MNQIRNVAVIAHVDHGKTTLIDALLKQTHIFRDNQAEMQQEQILDSNDLERERGITIMAKNCAINFNDTKINIIDTPGHADFSGEVERTLGMADGALLIIDAQEGPMPQTRFVLKKALELDLRIIVVINKIDKINADLSRTEARIDDLFLDLATSEEQLHFPKLYAIARDGKIFADYPQDMSQEATTETLLETIIKEIPAPQQSTEGPFKLSVTSLDYDAHLGRIVVGKIAQGKITKGAKVILTDNPNKTYSVDKLMVSQGLGREEVTEAAAGEIIAFTGISDAKIGVTVADPADTTPLASQAISEPTLHMSLSPNSSPFAGNEGKFTTSRQIEERLNKELETNVSLRLEKLDGSFKVSGRGELHLSILLETMRREGYEMEVGKPEVIIKEIDGVKKEPLEEVTVLVPNEYQGVINQEFGKRFGELKHMEPINDTETEFVFHIPARATLGIRSVLMTQTKGTIVYNSQVIGWEPLGKLVPQLRNGVLIASETGESLAYGLNAAQARGILFINPGEKVYEGQIVGLQPKENDMEVNVCKGKKLTNMRSKSSDGVIQLPPATKYSLEQALDFLEADEFLEITPESLRLRKRFLTDIERRRNKR